MKLSLSRALPLLAVLAAPVLGFAQTEPGFPDPAAAEERSIPLLTAEQLDELLGPIALYPDALIALILPAATMPTDLVLASRYLGAGGDTAKVDEQPWDESVRALAHYPDVVKWMDDKLSWAILIGDAFVAQPVDVMQSIQRLRAKARAAGTLVDSDEQKVMEEEGSIRIVPARPEIIYVPYYDPAVVYVNSGPSWGWRTSVISYRWSYPTGVWLSYDCDWSNHRVWVVHSHRRHRWYHDRDWWHSNRRHRYHHDRDYGHGWTPRHDHWRDRRDRDGHRDRDGRRDGVRPRHDRPVPGRDGWWDLSREERRRPGDRTRDERVNRPGHPRGNRVDLHEGRDDRTRTPPARNVQPRPERRPSNPHVVTRPETPRVKAPGTPPRQPVVRDSRPDAAPAPRRWIDRAKGSGNPPPVRTEATRRAAPPPRVAPVRERSAPDRPQVARIPLPTGGSRKVVVESAPARERAPQARAARSEDRGSRQVRAERSGGGSRTERRSDKDR